VGCPVLLGFGWRCRVGTEQGVGALCVRREKRFDDENGMRRPIATAEWMLPPKLEQKHTYGQSGRRSRGKPELSTRQQAREEAQQGAPKTKEEYIALIESTFEDVRENRGLRHKDDVEPEWVLEVLPDLDQWSNELRVVRFGNELDGPEATAGSNVKNKRPSPTELPLFIQDRQPAPAEGTSTPASRVRRAACYRGVDATPTEPAHEFEPYKFYSLDPADPAQHMLLFVEEGAEATMCPVVENMMVRHLHNESGRPKAHVKVNRRPLTAEDHARRRQSLQPAGEETGEGGGARDEDEDEDEDED
jgi:hypothetical protein